jgi:sugar phosphate isomerase/epimerase
MFCYSTNFTHPDPAFREGEKKKYIQWMDIASRFGSKTIRVLSGQAYPGVDRKQGVQWVVECIQDVLPEAQKRGLFMAMENHYKDNYWTYPEFAQKLEVFLEILEHFPPDQLKVNFDASNPIIGQEDPIQVMESVKNRIVSMHASDRYMVDGKLSHGMLGGGMVKYDKVFQILKEINFSGWVSVEDGIKGIDELKGSIQFLKTKLHQFGLN